MPITFTSSDLDTAASESGVVHQSTTNTDHDNASVLKQGYDYANFSEITPSPASCWPLHEDSGTTAFDVAGTDDGTITGAGPAATGTGNGPLGTTSYQFDGTDDHVESNGVAWSTGGSVVCWYYVPASPNSSNTLVNRKNPSGDSTTDTYLLQYRHSDSTLRANIGDGSSTNVNGTTWNPSTGQWYQVAFTWDGSTLRNYVDASQLTGTASFSKTPSDSASHVQWIGGDPAFGNYVNSRIGDVRVYSSALSSTQLQSLYDVVASSGSLITAGKTS